MNKTILRIDPSSFIISDCSMRFKLSNIDGYTSQTPCHKMHYGSSFHKAIAIWYRTKDKQKAMLAGMEMMNKVTVPESDWRTASHLLATIHEYIVAYEKHDRFVPSTNSSGELGIELPFKLPYRSYEHTDVILCGVVDAVGMWDEKIPVFKDIKTTAANPMYYFDTYELSPQMILYSYVLKQLGFAGGKVYPPAIIDGVFINKSGCKLNRSGLITFRDDQIDTFMECFSERVDDLVARLEGRRKWTHNYSQCEGKFGACQFKRVCSVREEVRSGMLESLFSRRIYDPATFGQE